MAVISHRESELLKSSGSVLLLCLTGIALILFLVSPSGASDENQVAIVVDFGNGQVGTKCVSFSEESITGFEALQRSGLPVETDFQTGGAAVCRIDGQGCPSDDCFCECRGGDECKYWSYWHFTNGTWNYSVAGSSLYQVRDGALDGWVWGLGSITQALPPPVIPFQDVCPSESAASPTATSTRPPTSTPMILPTFAPTESGPSPTLTVPVPTPTEPSLVDDTPAAPATGVAGLTPTPLAVELTETPEPQVLAQSEVPLLPTAAIGSQFDPYPVQSGGGAPEGMGSEPSVPAPELAVQLEGSGETGVATPETVAELGAVGGLAGSAELEGMATSTATPVVVSAVVGMDAAIDQPLTGPQPVRAVEPPNWMPYTGFVGLLLLLCSLALLVYRRKSASMDKVDR